MCKQAKLEVLRPAARILGSNGIDARLSEGAAQPGQHQFRVSCLGVNKDYNRGRGHVLEGILLILDPREELKHPGVSESCCGCGLPLLPNNHPLLPGSLQPLREVGSGKSVVGVEPDH